MIRSMTGFARAEAGFKKVRWTVEIHSLNHRYFEFSLKASNALLGLENQIRDLVQERMSRGKITVSLYKANENNSASVLDELKINEEAVRFYLTHVRQLKKKFKIGGELEVSQLLSFPGVFDKERSETGVEKFWGGIKKVLTEAVRQAILVQEREGAKLAEDMLKRLDLMRQALKKIEAFAKENPERIYENLRARLNLLLKENPSDTDRLNREAAFLADRSDITEETVRLGSHLDLFSERLKGAKKTVGKELDFLCQEMNREANTLGSKAQHFEISKEAILIKGEIEKIREQIQNIE